MVLCPGAQKSEVKQEEKEQEEGGKPDEAAGDEPKQEEEEGEDEEEGEVMNAYEREREERIAANRARMAALNLPGMAASFAQAHAPKRAAAPARPRGLAAKRAKRVRAPGPPSTLLALRSSLAWAPDDLGLPCTLLAHRDPWPRPPTIRVCHLPSIPPMYLWPRPPTILGLPLDFLALR
jgi:hypothetical protein